MAEPRTRYRELVTLTTHAVLDGRGVTASQLRWAAFHRRIDELPAELRTYVQTVAGTPPPILQAIVPDLDQAGAQAFWMELRDMLRGRQPELRLTLLWTAECTSADPFSPLLGGHWRLPLSA